MQEVLGLMNPFLQRRYGPSLSQPSSNIPMHSTLEEHPISESLKVSKVPNVLASLHSPMVWSWEKSSGKSLYCQELIFALIWIKILYFYGQFPLLIGYLYVPLLSHLLVYASNWQLPSHFSVALILSSSRQYEQSGTSVVPSQYNVAKMILLENDIQMI